MGLRNGTPSLHSAQAGMVGICTPGEQVLTRGATRVDRLADKSVAKKDEPIYLHTVCDICVPRTETFGFGTVHQFHGDTIQKGSDIQHGTNLLLASKCIEEHLLDVSLHCHLLRAFQGVGNVLCRFSCLKKDVQHPGPALALFAPSDGRVVYTAYLVPKRYRRCDTTVHQRFELMPPETPDYM